jgi:uncharacterized membrane protein YwzB
MLKKFLLAKGQGQKTRKFVSQAAKPILFVILILAVFLLAAQIALAATNIEPGLNVLASPLGLSTEDIRITIAKLIRIALGLLGIVTVVIIIYGGWLYMSSAGEADKVLKAKKVLTNAVIGLIIILLSYAIASFIIRALLEATGVGGPGAPFDYGGEGGALGNGIIENHYPARNAIDVPRNTVIVVTFKVPMMATSIINNIDGVDYANNDSVKIYPTADVSKVSITAKAYKTDDFKTYVFRPINLLGSPDQPVNYTVELTNQIKKSDGKNAFGAFGGYKWSFEVSTRIDLTPPQVESVIPKPSVTVPRNMVIQINFNEPINPMTISGKVELSTGGTVGAVLMDNSYDLITVKKGTDFIAGEFSYGNQYKTVEFVTNDLCGKNTCGGNIYCLPANAAIDVLVKAATLLEANKPTALFPYTGIVDMADNSLDGNKDGTAKGPQAQSTFEPYNLNNPVVANFGDDLTWGFQTNDVIDLIPPEIALNYIPEAGKQDVDPTQYFSIPFNKIMMATTLKSDRNYNEGYCECSADSDCQPNKCDFVNGYCVDNNQQRFICTNGIPPENCPNNNACTEQHHITLDQPTVENYSPRGYIILSENLTIGTPPQEYTMAYINHVALAEEMDYGIIVGSGVKDITQNCYQPCAGPGCVKNSVVGGKPGEYEQGTPWSGRYPSCQQPPAAP